MVYIVKILVEEIVPLLSDGGANLMRDVCELLGMKKLNTTAYDPQCDGLVERYNSENMLHDLVCNGTPWDCMGLPQHST